MRLKDIWPWDLKWPRWKAVLGVKRLSPSRVVTIKVRVESYLELQADTQILCHGRRGKSLYLSSYLSLTSYLNLSLSLSLSLYLSLTLSLYSVLQTSRFQPVEPPADRLGPLSTVLAGVGKGAEGIKRLWIQSVQCHAYEFAPLSDPTDHVQWLVTSIWGFLMMTEACLENYPPFKGAFN